MINTDILSVIVSYSDRDTVYYLTKSLKKKNQNNLIQLYLDTILKRDYRLKTNDIPECICFEQFVAMRPWGGKETGWKALLQISNPLARKTLIFYTIVEKIIDAKIFQNPASDVYTNENNLILLNIAVSRMVILSPKFHMELKNYYTRNERKYVVKVKDLVEFEEKLSMEDKEKTYLEVTEKFDPRDWSEIDDSECRNNYPVFETFDEYDSHIHFLDGVMLCILNTDTLYFAGVTTQSLPRPEAKRIRFVHRFNINGTSVSDYTSMRISVDKIFSEFFLGGTSRDMMEFRNTLSDIMEFRKELQPHLWREIRNIAAKQSERLGALEFQQREELEQYLDNIMPSFNNILECYEFCHVDIGKPEPYQRKPSRRVVVAMERLLRRCVNCFVFRKLDGIEWYVFGWNSWSAHLHVQDTDLGVFVHSAEPNSWTACITVDAINELKRIGRFVRGVVHQFLREKE